MAQEATAPSLGDFAVVKDSAGQLMVFTTDEHRKLCLIYTGENGHKDILDLHKCFTFSEQQIVSTLAASQDPNGSIYLAFALQEPDKADILFILCPMSAIVADWKALSGTKDFFSGPQEDITIRQILLGKCERSLYGNELYPQVHLLLQHRTLTTEDISILTVDRAAKRWSNFHAFKLSINPHRIMSWSIGILSMYRGMFVLYKETATDDSKTSLQFVGLDPQEATPVLQSIHQLVPDGASQITTFENSAGLTDLLIAGNELWWLSAGDCIKSRKKLTALDDADDYSSPTQLPAIKKEGVLTVWFLTSASILSHQQFTSDFSVSPPLRRKNEAVGFIDQSGENDRFVILLDTRPAQIPVIVTSHAVMNMIKEAKAYANAPAVASAREVYINHLEEFIDQQEQLDIKLSEVEIGSQAAINKLSETSETLKAHLTQGKIASTSVATISIVGTVLLFTPFLEPVGAGILAGVAIGTATAGDPQGLFEAEASKAFTEIFNSYASSAKQLDELVERIGKKQDLLTTSLATFLTLTHAFPFPDPPAISRKGVPKLPDGQARGPSTQPDNLTKGTTTGLAARAAQQPLAKLANFSTKATAKLASSLGGDLLKLLPKALPTLGRILPVAGVLFDVKSIVDTWTTSNETLEAFGKLKSGIQKGIEALRLMARDFHAALEAQIGNMALRETLRKLLRLRKPPPGPPLRPAYCCKILEMIQSGMGLGFQMFIGLLGHRSEEPEEPKRYQSYSAEVVSQADLDQLSQKPMSATVVDSVYERYPDRKNSDDKQQEERQHTPQEDGGIGSISFRAECTAVWFSNESVYNVDGTSPDHRGGSWVGFWESFLNLAAKGNSINCRIVEQNGIVHSGNMVGGHMELVVNPAISLYYWYILPICSHHNSKIYDRPTNYNGWIVDRPLLTKTGSYAVMIHPASWYDY